MEIMDILRSPKPGDTLMANREHWPLFLDLGLELSAGPPPHHSGNVLQHLARCMNECAGDPLAVWMALAHDAGKLTTPKAMLPHHYGHESRGRHLARIWARELGLDETYSRAGELCAWQHMRAGHYMDMRPGKQFDLLNIINSQPCAHAFWKVVNADTKSCIADLAHADWRLLQDARARGLNEQQQIHELSCHGAGSREKRAGLSARRKK